MALPMTGPVWIVEGVFDDSNDEAVAVAASIAPGRIDGGQEGAVAERTHDLEDHLIGHAAHDVDVAALRLKQRGITVKPAIPEHQRARRNFSQQRTGQGEFALLCSFDEGLHDEVGAGFGKEDHVNLRIPAVHSFAVPSGLRSAEGGPGAPGTNPLTVPTRLGENGTNGRRRYEPSERFQNNPGAPGLRAIPP